MIDFIISHWEALSSLLLSFVAIAIAIISSRQTSKQAERQIASIQVMTDTSTKNADKQIEEIKKMTNQVVIDTKKHLISMKSTAVALLENYLLSLEANIWSSKDEEKRIKELLKDMSSQINQAEEDAEMESRPKINYLISKEEKDRFDERLEYLNHLNHNLILLREKTIRFIEDIKKYRHEEICDIERN